MNKSNLIKFIELYNLGGTVERVKLESDGKNISTKIISEDKKLSIHMEWADVQGKLAPNRRT